MPDFRKQAAALDRDDPLARFRDEFGIPANRIYLDGNSLGLMPRRARAALDRVVAEWERLAIEAWTDAQPPWVSLAEQIAGRLAPMIGASTDEVAVTGATTLNLHQLLATLFDPSADRKVVLADELAFASDVHAIESHLRLRGLDPARCLRKVASPDGRTLTEESIVGVLADDVQLAVFSSVQYRSGQLLDLARISREARARGVLIGWDCSHSVGAVPHAFDEDGADFAFWCSYKYLNAGPGAVGGLYLNRRHFDRRPGLAGWWGVRPERRFALEHTHEPAPGAAALQIGTPHLFSLAPLGGSLELFDEAGGVGTLRRKSTAQTEFLFSIFDESLAGLEFGVITPRDAARRGGHVALTHPEAWRLCRALRARGVIADFRAPDIIRLAPAPLYNTFGECADAMARLAEIVRSGEFARFSHAPSLVT